MITKCANPVCSTPFHYMRDGKIFRMEFNPEPQLVRSDAAGDPRPIRRVEHFWLCGSCAATMTLIVNQDGKVSPVPIEPVEFRRAAAS
jgi:hypothetical protein